MTDPSAPLASFKAAFDRGGSDMARNKRYEARMAEELQRLRTELTQWVSDCDANETDTDCFVMDHREARS